MAVKDVQIKVRNATNTDWDDINPKTKASLVNLASTNFTADNVEGGMDELFTSVSSGKTQIASAITGMGQIAAGSDTFAVLSGKISDISNDATAIASDVLTTQTFYSGGVKQTGTMANRGSVTYTPSDSTQTGSSGYYSSITVNPRPALSGTALTSEVLSGRTFYGSSYTKQTGTIPSKGAQTFTPGTTSQTISAGQYLTGTQTILGDADLVAGNIKSGVNIFGVTGNLLEGAQVTNSQNGLTSMSTGTSTLNITISSVSTANSIVIIESNDGDSYANRMFVKGVLTSSTNLQLSRAGTGSVANVTWKVVTWSNIKSIQTGTTSFSGSGSASISTITTSKSILFCSFTSSNASYGSSAWYQTISYIYSSTQIRFSNPSSSSSNSVYWQVIEFN